MTNIWEMVSEYWRAMLVAMTGWLGVGVLTLNGPASTDLLYYLFAGVLTHTFTFAALRTVTQELSEIWVWLITSSWVLIVLIFFVIGDVATPSTQREQIANYLRFGLGAGGFAAGIILGYACAEAILYFRRWRIWVFTFAWLLAHVAWASGSFALTLAGGALTTLVLFNMVVAADRLRWGAELTLADLFRNPEAYTAEKPKPFREPRRLTLMRVLMLLCGAALLLLLPGVGHRLGSSMLSPVYRNEPTPAQRFTAFGTQYRIARAPEGQYHLIGLTGSLGAARFDHQDEFVWFYDFHTTSGQIYQIREWQLEPFNQAKEPGVQPERTTEVSPWEPDR